MRHNRALPVQPRLCLHQFKKRVILTRMTNRSLTHLMAERKGRVERKGQVRQEQLQLGREHKLLNRHHRRKHPLNHTCNYHLYNNPNRQHIPRVNLRNLPQQREHGFSLRAWIKSAGVFLNVRLWQVFHHRGTSKKKGNMGIYAFCDTDLPCAAVPRCGKYHSRRSYQLLCAYCFSSSVSGKHQKTAWFRVFRVVADCWFNPFRLITRCHPTTFWRRREKTQ